MTGHLSMVARGQLPGGIARGGQRYGRPQYAGTTRQRVNAEVARLAAGGWTLSHWLRAVEAVPDPAMLEALLRAEESRLKMWDLRVVGWNRGLRLLLTLISLPITQIVAAAWCRRPASNPGVAGWQLVPKGRLRQRRCAHVSMVCLSAWSTDLAGRRAVW